MTTLALYVILILGAAGIVESIYLSRKGKL